ncbi:MAG TPA: elongation factor G, partial [Candidatus Dojkabacteria bacterium]
SLKSIQKELNDNAVAIELPLGIEHELHGVVDLITMKAYTYDDDGMDFKEIEIPADVKEKAEKMHGELIDKIADANDDLLEKYLADGVLEVDEIYEAIRINTLAGKIFPVLGGDSRKAHVKFILNAVCRFLPSPVEKKHIYEDKETHKIHEYKGEVVGINPSNGELEHRRLASDEPLSALAFKIAVDPHVGTLTFARIYSGTIDSGSYVYNTTTDKKERIGRIMMMHANSREEIKTAHAGDIVALVGMKDSFTGNTLSDEGQRIALESIDFPEPVVTLSVEPKTKSDQEKMGVALRKLMQEDPTFRAATDKETGQTTISGMGELHLEIKVDIMKREYGIEVNTGKPQVAYRESVEREIEHQEVLKKQTGGAGQFADIVFDMIPNERGGGYEFIDSVKGGSIPREYIPSVDKGMQSASKTGVLGGYPVVDFKIKLKDGSYHDVDSNTETFRLAATRGFKEAMRKASPILLEPIMRVVVSTPEEFSGDVTGALSAKRGKISKMEPKGKVQEIVADVPIGNMFGWVNDLRSMTKGKAQSSMEFSHYEKVPSNLVSEVLGNE